MRHGRSYWKMNAALLHEEGFQEELRQKLPYHGDVVGTSAKAHIKRLFIREGTVKRQEETRCKPSITPVFMAYCSARSHTRKGGQHLIIIKPKL